MAKCLLFDCSDNLVVLEGDLRLLLLEQQLRQRLGEVDVRQRMTDERSHHQESGLGIVSDHHRNFLEVARGQNLFRTFGQKRILDVEVTVDERSPRVSDEQVVAGLILVRKLLGETQDSDLLEPGAAHLGPETLQDGLV